MTGLNELKIYRLSYDLALKVHEMTMELPKNELYEQGSQVRRSSKSIKDNISEGYGRQRYKDEFIRFLIFAHSSCDETMSQLDMISDIYYKKGEIDELRSEYKKLSKMIYRYIKFTEQNNFKDRNL